MDDPETARDCLELLDRLVTASADIANAMVNMETAVMLLTVCANVGGDELQACVSTHLILFSRIGLCANAASNPSLAVQETAGAGERSMHCGPCAVVGTASS